MASFSCPEFFPIAWKPADKWAEVSSAILDQQPPGGFRSRDASPKRRNKLVAFVFLSATLVLFRSLVCSSRSLISIPECAAVAELITIRIDWISLDWIRWAREKSFLAHSADDDSKILAKANDYVKKLQMSKISFDSNPLSRHHRYCFELPMTHSRKEILCCFYGKKREEEI